MISLLSVIITTIQNKSFQGIQIQYTEMDRYPCHFSYIILFSGKKKSLFKPRRFSTLDFEHVLLANILEKDAGDNIAMNIQNIFFLSRLKKNQISRLGQLLFICDCLIRVGNVQCTYFLATAVAKKKKKHSLEDFRILNARQKRNK